jgi:hypothetical protein
MALANDFNSKILRRLPLVPLMPIYANLDLNINSAAKSHYFAASGGLVCINPYFRCLKLLGESFGSK